MILVVAIFFVLVLIAAATTNRDIFSPAKLFLFVFMVFYAGSVTGTNVLTAVLISLVLAVGIVTVLIEAKELDRLRSLRSLVPRRPKVQAFQTSSNPAPLLWLASAPAIFAQSYMVQRFGGIEGYVNNIGFRVVEWAGLGWAVTLTGWMGPLTVAYFAVGLRRHRTPTWWLFFGAHFLTFLGMALLSGSRGALLVVILLQVITYHYIRGPVRSSQAAFVAAGLVIAAMALGTLRNTAKFEYGQFTTGSSASQQLFSFNSFHYGVQPLEILSRAEYMPLAGGSTFISVLTNVIPRTLWSEKPETGGVFFTRYYLGDAWGGYSNITPTFLGEWIINFGWAVGIAGFLISYLLLMGWLVRFYLRSVARVNSNLADVVVIDFVLYVHVAWACVALMVGEVTSVLLSLVISDVIPLLLIRFFLSQFGERERPRAPLPSASVP